MMRRGILLMMAAVLAAGCEEPLPVIPDLPPPQPEVLAEPPRPTEEELRDGPRERIRLGLLPLSVEAPVSWDIATYARGEVVFLEGPSPSGDVRIQLSHRALMSRDQIEYLIEGAETQKQRDPDIRLVQFDAMNGLEVFQMQSVGRAPPAVGLDEQGQPLPGLGRPMRWTINVFVPSDDLFESYELNFIGLTVEQYEADGEFLREIINSLRHEGVAVGVPG